MNQILVNQRTRVNKDEIIHVKRNLPSAISKINVKLGDEVSPDYVLAEGKGPSGFRTVNLAEELKINPKDGLKFLNRPLGNNIFKEELLASKDNIFGLGKKILLSPADGVLDFYDDKTGRLRIRLFPATVKLACGVWGIIEEINEEKGIIIIKTMASLIYGMLGSGKEREGALNVIGSTEVLVSARQLEATMRGQIIVGGEIIFADGLSQAVEFSLAGIVTGGINAKDYRAIAEGWNIYTKKWSDIGLSLLVTEGFGSIPIGDEIFPFLQQSHGKFCILDGNRNRLILPSDDSSCMINIRKTTLPKGVFVERHPELIASLLSVGQKVRMISQDHLGVQGVVEAIDQTPSKMPSGVRSRLVTVNCKARKVRIPYQNLEIII